MINLITIFSIYLDSKTSRAARLTILFLAFMHTTRSSLRRCKSAELTRRTSTGLAGGAYRYAMIKTSSRHFVVPDADASLVSRARSLRLPRHHSPGILGRPRDSAGARSPPAFALWRDHFRTGCRFHDMMGAQVAPPPPAPPRHDFSLCCLGA